MLNNRLLRRALPPPPQIATDALFRKKTTQIINRHHNHNRHEDDGLVSDNEHSILSKRKLDEQLVDTPSSRSSGGDIDRFFASGSPIGHPGATGGSGGYKARDMAARAGGGCALTPVIKRRAILRGDRTPIDGDSGYVGLDAEEGAAAAAASALLAVRSSEGPKR